MANYNTNRKKEMRARKTAKINELKEPEGKRIVYLNADKTLKRVIKEAE